MVRAGGSLEPGPSAPALIGFIGFIGLYRNIMHLLIGFCIFDWVLPFDWVRGESESIGFIGFYRKIMHLLGSVFLVGFSS